MTAQLGAGELVDSPRPRLLEEITGIRPEATGTHVLLGDQGVRSVQRLALDDVGGAILARFWPAELKSQADYLYHAGRGEAMVSAALRLGWTVVPSPHLAFFNSRPSQRLYMAPDIPADEYARRWQGGDDRHIGEHDRNGVRQCLWPWLKDRGYADDGDDDVLEQFFAILGRRRVHLRPGMRFSRRWPPEATRDRREFARTVRQEVDSIFGAAGEPPLPASA